MRIEMGQTTRISLACLVVLCLTLTVYRCIYVTFDLGRNFMDMSEDLRRRFHDNGIYTRPSKMGEDHANGTASDIFNSVNMVNGKVTYLGVATLFGGSANMNASDVFKSLNVSRTAVCQPREIAFLTSSKPKFALASFPGSGNTWTRHLLEQLTGTWTGSVYSDAVLRGFFPGEALCARSNETFIVKSHRLTSTISGVNCPKLSSEDNKNHFDGAILLLRSPYGAILAEFNRRHGGQTSTPNITLLIHKPTVWRNFVSQMVVKWRRHSEYWLTNYDGPLHVLFYENLKSRLALELYQLSVFLNTSVSYHTLWCTMERGRGEFKRKRPDWLTFSTVYQSDMQRQVDEQIDMVEVMVRMKNVSHMSYRDTKVL